MKRNLLTVLFVFSTLFAIANDEVTMVSYEQTWLDNEGTLALKNNTDKPVHNVAFIIKYLDMKGNELDYKEFYRDINIAPGMTKKVNVDAYERGRNYHYYKTKDNYGNPAFKIQFVLKDINIDEESSLSPDSCGMEEVYDTHDDYGSSSSFHSAICIGMTEIVVILVVLLVLGIQIGLYILVAFMAKKRNRNVLLWVLLSFIGTPLIIAIILLCIGKEEKIEEIE